MCRYKPCAIWMLSHALLSFGMIFFCTLMYMSVGGSYPSFRFDATLKWSILHYLFSAFLSGASAMLVYKEVVQIFANRFSFVLIATLAVSSTCLCATIWPPITKNEFRNYLLHEYAERKDVPAFANWFQTTQGCCGVDNYKDYIKFSGTRLITTKEDISNDPNEIDDSHRPDAEVLTQVVFNVPRSCCAMPTRKNKQCGEGIPYTTDKEMDLMINNLTKGCYKVLYDIIYNYEPVQVAMMYVVFRTYPLLDALLHIVGMIG